MLLETIKTYIKLALIQIAILSVSLFYGALVVLKFIYFRFQYGPEYFQPKERTLPPRCLQDPAFKHSYIKLKNIKLHCVEAGDRSKPLILFVHGYPEFWYSWANQLKYFAKDYWVVAFDLRGYGDSDKPNGVSNYRVDNLVGDVKELVGLLGKDKCILVGHDWGGIIAWYTTALPGSTGIVDKLIILNAPHPAAFQMKIATSFKQFLKSWYIFFFQLPYLPEMHAIVDDIGIFNRVFAKTKGTHPPEFYEAYKYTFGKRENWTPPINFYRASLTASNVYNRAVDSLPKIQQPTLIIWGDNDLALEPDFPERSIEFCTGITEIQRIKSGNHFIQNDFPEEVNAAIEKFLR